MLCWHHSNAHRHYHGCEITDITTTLQRVQDYCGTSIYFKMWSVAKVTVILQTKRCTLLFSCEVLYKIYRCHTYIYIYIYTHTHTHTHTQDVPNFSWLFPPLLSKKVPINIGPKVNRFRDIHCCVEIREMQWSTRNTLLWVMLSVRKGIQ